MSSKTKFDFREDVEQVLFEELQLTLQYHRRLNGWRMGSLTNLEKLEDLTGGGWVPCSQDTELRGTGQLRNAQTQILTDENPWWFLFGEHLGAEVFLTLNNKSSIKPVLVGPLWAACWRSEFGAVVVNQAGYDESFAYLNEEGLDRFAYCSSLTRSVVEVCVNKPLEMARKIAALSGFEVEVGTGTSSWNGNSYRRNIITMNINDSGIVLTAMPG